MWADRLSLVATGRTSGSTFSKYLTPLPLVVLPLLDRYAVRNLMFTVVTDCCAGKRATPNEKARLRIVLSQNTRAGFQLVLYVRVP